MRDNLTVVLPGFELLRLGLASSKGKRTGVDEAASRNPSGMFTGSRTGQRVSPAPWSEERQCAGDVS